MSVVIDTNLLIYAVHASAPQHELARNYIESQRQQGGFCVTWSILYEWLRVVTHPRVFSRPLSPAIARSFVLDLADDPRVDILRHTPNHARFLKEVLDMAPPLRGNLLHDAHIAAAMREHGIHTIATADQHFRLFPFLQIVNPLG